MKGMTWRDCPHFFAKFKLIDPNGDSWNAGYFLNKYPDHIKDSTLIARRVEDMTDEEVKNCPTFKEGDLTPIEEMKYRLWMWTYSQKGQYEIPAIVQNYLLSIRVYPFSQSHFSDGIVFAPAVK